MGESTERPAGAREKRPMRVEGLPDEEGVSRAEVAEGLEREPDEKVNRPDQPDMTEEERRQYDAPTASRPIAEGDRPEDR